MIFAKPHRQLTRTATAFVLSVISAITATSCCATAPPPEATEASIEAEVLARLREFEATERTLSAPALLDFLDPEFTMLQDGTRVDHAATVVQMEATLPTLRSFEPRFDDVEVLVLSQDHALTSMIFHDEITDAEGTVTRMQGPSTLLWRKRQGTWRILFADSDHYPK